MAIAVFNAGIFKARYPEFLNVLDARLEAFFLESGFYLSNDDCSPVENVNNRLVLLNMVTAHIAFLAGSLSANGMTPPPVGRTSQASEGTVSASLEYSAPANATEAWWLQTPYGAAFWAATAYLRTMQYVPSPTNGYSQNNFYFSPGRRRGW